MESCPSQVEVNGEYQQKLVTSSWLLYHGEGKYYNLKMFFPQATKPSRSDVQAQIDKVYPGARVNTYLVSDHEQENHFFTSKEQHGQRKKERISLEDLTRKDESLMKRKIKEATLEQARRLEIPDGHSFCARMKE